MSEEPKIPEEQPADKNLHPDNLNVDKVSESSAEVNNNKSEPADEKPETNHPEEEINDMEIHHHPHIHHQKKWKEYLFEFLMLFLAITAGFFVENQREHFIESKREKEYVRSLCDDLKADTMVIERTIREKEWALAKLDSLATILDSSAVKQNNELVYYFERFLTKNDVFTAQDVTYRQLLNSGNFRYFKKMALYKKISGYYNLYERYNILIEAEFGNPKTLIEIESRLFDGTDLNTLYNPSGRDFYSLFKRPDRKFKLVNPDKEYLNRLKITTGATSYSVGGSIPFLGWLKGMATELLVELESEYNLE